MFTGRLRKEERIMSAKDSVKRALELLSPEGRTAFEAVKELRGQVDEITWKAQVVQRDYDDMHRILVVILHALKEQGAEEYRIHESQFQRVRDTYRIERRVDAGTKEVVLSLVDMSRPMTIGPRQDGGGK